MINKVEISEEIAEEIRNNKKIITDLNIKEIYIIFTTFTNANKDLG